MQLPLAARFAQPMPQRWASYDTGPVGGCAGNRGHRWFYHNLAFKSDGTLGGNRGSGRLTGGQGADCLNGGTGTDSATGFTPSEGHTQEGVENQPVLTGGGEEPAITSQLFLPIVQN